MRYILLILLIALAAIVGAQYFIEEPGLVTVSWGEWLVETSLAFATLAVIVATAAIWILLRMVAAAWSLPFRLAAWRQRRRIEAARRALSQGLIEMAEGRWVKAEKLFVRAARNDRSPLVCYLGAARAAQMQAAHQRRDEHLRAAIEGDPKAGIAVGFTQAELQLDAGQAELALATLGSLEERTPEHPHLLRLRALLARRMNDAETTLALIPKLRRHKIFPVDELDAMEHDAALTRISHCAQNCDGSGLDSLWKGLPRKLTAEPALIAACARGWAHLDQSERAATVLRTGLKQDYDDELIAVFGQIRHEDPMSALALAERFLRSHERNAVLLLALGRLARGAKLWGKARSYIDAAIGIAPTAEAYRELAELLDRMGGPEQARDCYRKGLRLATEGIAETTVDLRTPRPATAPRTLSTVDDDVLGA